MAHIVNPHNIDVDDDAVFLGALTQGLIWIEDDDDSEPYEPRIESLESSNQTKVHTLKHHGRSVNHIVVSGEYIISASTDRTLGVSNWKTGEHLHKLRGHKASVNAIALQDNIAISASSDKTIRTWNWKTGERLGSTEKFSHTITGLDIHGDALALSLSTEVWILNWQTSEVLQTFTGLHSTDVIAISIYDDLIFSMSWRLLLVCNWKTGEIINKIDVDYSHREAGVCLDKEFVVFGSYNGIEVLDWKSCEFLDESHLMNKSNNISNRAFPTSFGVFVYSLESAKWCHYRISNAYDQATILVDDCAKMITADPGGWIYIIELNPSLKSVLEKNSGYSPLTAKKTEITCDYKIGDILAEVTKYIRTRDEQWVNFTRVDQHIRNTFPQIDLRNLKGASKKYKNLRMLTEDYPQRFLLRPDEHKSGLFYISLADSYDTDQILAEVRKYIRTRDEQWVNLTRVSQHIREVFPNVNIKNLKTTGKRYRSFPQLIAGYPNEFELRLDTNKQGLYWIRLKRSR
jgi:hypothetical protein